MTHAFATQFDRIPQCHRNNPVALETARAVQMSVARDAPFDPEHISPALIDPTSLRGARMDRFIVQPHRILIDLTFGFPNEDDPREERYAGPARLIIERDPTYRCSGTGPAEADPNDPIVWSELHALPEAGLHTAELIIVCASGRHWVVRAQRIVFATLTLPC